VHLATTLMEVTLPTTIADAGSFNLVLIGFLVHQLSGKTQSSSAICPSCINKSDCNFIIRPDYKNRYSTLSGKPGSTKYKKIKKIMRSRCFMHKCTNKYKL
jgi:hypothetical protein